MLKLTITDLENDHTVKRFGSEHELLQYLKLEYPLVADAPNMRAAKAILDESDLFQVTTEPYEPSIEENMLPPDYLNIDYSNIPDPWPRMDDQPTI